MKDLNYKIALISLSIIVIFPILSKFLGISGGIKIPALTAILSIAVLIADKNFQDAFFSKYVVIWFILMLYHYINAYLKNVEGTNADIFMLHVVNTTVAMGLTVYLFTTNPKFTLPSITAIYLINLFIAYYIISRIGFDPETRFGSAETVHPNILGQFAGLTCILIAMFIVQRRKSLIYFILLMSFPLLIAFLTQSRNALVLVAFSLIIYIVGYLLEKKMDIKTIIFFSAFSILLFYLSKFVLNDTTSGLRIISALEGNSMQVESYYATNSIWDKLLGERIVYYVIGFSNFIHNFWTGIGLWNFSSYNQFNYPLHSEYMVHLAEGGLIGVSLYFLFIGNIIISFIKSKNKPSFLYWQYLLTFISILIVGITARVFAYTQFFPVYGLIIGYLLSQKNLKRSPSLRVIFERSPIKR